ncbi:unnamed protein product [Lactuca virosa]|uniref:Uncharacterized protein n=1 Tax=Lactuca virosa TaxID=75947 RepID=A0AAU9PKL1_9ASTR|nr:unnamed protein product [Lactuca virosa]
MFSDCFHFPIRMDVGSSISCHRRYDLHIMSSAAAIEVEMSTSASTAPAPAIQEEEGNTFFFWGLDSRLKTTVTDNGYFC